MNQFIEIQGARIHNLKNIDLRIPRNQLTVITGVSGSGKSSLAFDTLYEEGKRRYLLFSGTQFMVDTVPSFESITGLSPTVAVEQRIIRQSNPRSTVGTRTKIESLLAILYATYGSRNDADGSFPDDWRVQGLPLPMEMFLKNSPKGMCVKCLGTGRITQIDEQRLFGDDSKKINELVYGIAKRGTTQKMLADFCAFHGITPSQSLNSLNEELLFKLKYGDGGKTSFPGYAPWINQVCRSQGGRLRYLLTRDKLLNDIICPKCKGSGLGEEALQTVIGGKTITQLENMDIKDLRLFLNTQRDSLSGPKLIAEILAKLDCMIDVGLHHLALSRRVLTLSGGEIQRLFLASYIITEMDSIIFIFDEPTIGLHEVEKEKLITMVKNLVKRGNTVVAVEHDPNFMRASDYIIDLGPGAGPYGGERIFQGTLADFLSCKDSKTAPYLSGEKILAVKQEFKPAPGCKLLTINNANLHNLRNVSVSIPLGLMVGIAGVSGSGKSSLINDTLMPKLKEMLQGKFIYEVDSYEVDSHEVDSHEVDSHETDISHEMNGRHEMDEAEGIETAFDHAPLACARVTGAEHLKKCIVVDQRPIGRSRTSCPATYTGIFDRVRALFAKTPEATQRGYTAGLFTVNSEGGCRVCKGEGVTYFHVGYGNFVNLDCEACGGTGFVEEAINITLDGKNIKEILAMTVSEAVDFFGRKDTQAFDKTIFNILKTLERVGMGYITLGQKTPTISGGEAQRIKLAKELSKQNGKDNLYILDEPTTGLSFADTQRLIELLEQLAESGNTVIVIEHDPSVLSNCDYIIEMGPGGGSDGGDIIATGAPNELKTNERSIIGKYLKY